MELCEIWMVRLQSPISSLQSPVSEAKIVPADTKKLKSQRILFFEFNSILKYLLIDLLNEMN